jgi:hypothetical protein
MSAIGKGDFVEKVGDSITVPVARHGLVAQVVGLTGNKRNCAKGHYEIGLFIAGLTRRSDGTERSWCPCSWKLIYRPKPDAFTDLLKLPADAPREPVAA